ncbi:hemerythrin domain-containing protein [Bacillus swezeyi]|uniref:Hemerythrin domain-containing protein n=1 Tax=Bacillus swezeyi TaxID=1925020 RepID=A0A5M8RTJ8_9BACI|nr:hemerythrin domain-containing protein [Bacillus swezeyi]KAA6451955.1 hemerythrin domain-containing protein [Bacillus swezeyi]TYS36178.1 hemerythrin domain-containing protein [Bacillus swezeyi]
MSGPSLNKLAAHRSIHDGAVTEGRDLMEVLERVYGEKHKKHAIIAARALLDHWETRTISHADSEEEGLYKRKLEENPDISHTLSMLKRDHDLLRILVKEIKERLDEQGVNDDVIDRFKAIYVLVQIHNRDEEAYLLDHH